MLDAVSNDKKIVIEWGFFGLIEFLISESKNIQRKYKNALDIGSSHGNHTEIMRHFGLKVDQIDKYEINAEINDDFNTYNFKKKYDVIFCSHVIEHQRNVGFFLDKIFDTLTENGVLVISGPKHPAERFVQGHIQSTIMPIFLQNLIFAGFDCKNAKILSLAGIENSFIIKKSKDFNLKERIKSNYRWTEKHQNRSFFKLIEKDVIKNDCLFVKNCEIWKLENLGKNELEEYPSTDVALSLNFPNDYEYKDFTVNFIIDGQFFLFDQNKNILSDNNTRIVQLKI
tara:strand:- start:319 stop:1170 length:852 start_codon:yes stop_codon:yes gene_type:complete